MQQMESYPHEIIAMNAVNNDTFFQNFKRDNKFRIVLEHVTNELGIQYIRSIKKIIEANSNE